DMMLFFHRVAGHMVLAALLQAASADPHQLHAAVPYAEVGDRFGISRTHVRQLLSAAERTGLVKLRARGGHRVEILPRLWASYDRSIAGGMFLHDLVYGPATGRPAASERCAVVLEQRSLYHLPGKGAGVFHAGTRVPGFGCANEIYFRRESRDGPQARPRLSAARPGARRRGDRVKRRTALASLAGAALSASK